MSAKLHSPSTPTPRSSFTLLAGVLLLSGAGFAADNHADAVRESSPRTLSARDTIRIDSVGSPVLSPDGSWVLYTKASRDLDASIDLDEELERTTQVWRVRSDGSQRRQLTRGSEDATQPAWSPDGGKISFLSPRGQNAEEGDADGPKAQVQALWLDGGEAWEVTSHEEGISQYAWAPDGQTIAFLALDSLSDDQKAKKERQDDTVVVDQEFRFTHLWLWDIEAEEARRLTEGDYDVSDLQFSPRGTHIAYVRRPNTKLDDAWNSDVWVVELASGEHTKLLENPGTDASPRWSPDGKRVAFATKSHVLTNTYYSELAIAQIAAPPEVITLLGDFDRDFSTPIWGPDGSTIYWSTGDGTTSRIFSLDLATQHVQPLATPQGANFAFELSSDGRRWVWQHSAPDWPSEIYTADLDFASPVRVSDANSWLRDEQVRLATTTTVRWKNSEGQEIEGVLTLPPDYDASKAPYPFILNPHGGPSGAVTTSFSSTNQFLAGNGFVVLQPNFRGSSNYGQGFLNANRNEWGQRDYDDCMTGVDHAIAQGWADPERLIAYGWSYGGYLSFWIATQTDRFKVVSPGAGLSNLYSMYSTTDISNYLGWFFGTPWDNEDIYRQLSPIRHVKNVKSKMLILSGAEDERVPPEQSVEFYRALRDLDKDAELILFPREGHGIREPRHQMDRLRRYLDSFAAAVGIEPGSETAWHAAAARAANARENVQGGDECECDDPAAPSTRDTEATEAADESEDAEAMVEPQGTLAVPAAPAASESAAAALGAH